MKTFKFFFEKLSLINLRKVKRENIGILKEVFQEPSQQDLKAVLQGLWSYMMYHFELKRDDIGRIVDQFIPPERKEDFMTAAELLKKEGLEEGLQQGRQEGQLLTAREALVEALEIRFGFVTEPVRTKIDQSNDMVKLRELFRLAIQCGSLNEVIEQLS